MKRFRNPCHSMLGPTIATHLSDPVRCRTRSYVNNMSCTCFFHSRYHSFSCIKDCVHIEIKKVSPPLCFHLFQNTDRKSTRLNSSHVAISYAVFCLKKKKDRKEYSQDDSIQ